MVLNRNTRALLFPLLATFAVVLALTWRYPPACYEPLERGLLERTQANAPALRTIGDALERTAALALLPALLWGGAWGLGRIRRRAVGVAGLLWALWLLVLSGWLLSGAWHPSINYD